MSNIGHALVVLVVAFAFCGHKSTHEQNTPVTHKITKSYTKQRLEARRHHNKTSQVAFFCYFFAFVLSVFSFFFFLEKHDFQTKGSQVLSAISATCTKLRAVAYSEAECCQRATCRRRDGKVGPKTMLSFPRKLFVQFKLFPVCRPQLPDARRIPEVQVSVTVSVMLLR